MAFNINEVLSEISNSGILKNNKFEVEFGMPPSLLKQENRKDMISANKRVRLYAEQANIPGVALITGDIRRYGIGPTEKKPIVPVFSDMAITFRGDGEGQILRFMQEWLKTAINFQYGKGILDKVNGMSAYEIGYKNDTKNQTGYAIDAFVKVFDDTGIEQIRILLRQCFPIYVADVPLSWNFRNDYMKIPTVLTFMDWNYASTTDAPQQEDQR